MPSMPATIRWCWRFRAFRSRRSPWRSLWWTCSIPSSIHAYGRSRAMFAVLRDLIRYNIEFAIGLVLVTVVVVFATLSLFSPVDPSLIYVAIPDQPPSAQYWFGTNSRGQDLFWQLSAAFRNSLIFGLTVAVLSR